MARLAASAPSLFGRHSCTYFAAVALAAISTKAIFWRIPSGHQLVSIVSHGHPDHDWMTGATRKSEKNPKKMAWVKIFETSRLWSFCKNVSEFQAHLSAEMTIANVVTRRQINSKFNGRIWRMPTLTIINHI